MSCFVESVLRGHGSLGKRTKKKNVDRSEKIHNTGIIYTADSRLNYLAVIPGLALIAATLLDFLMCVSMPSMKNSQFATYSDLFRMGFWASFIAGAVFLIAYYMIYVRGAAGMAGIASGLRGQMHWVFFALFAVCIVVSTIINGIDDAALHGIPYRNQGFLHVLLYIGVLCPVSMHLKTPGLRRIIIAGYLITADLIAVAAAAFLGGVSIDAFEGKKGICAIFFNGNHYGYFLVMAVLLAAGLWIEEDKRSFRVFGMVSLVLNMIILFVNDSMGCILAVFIVLLCAAAVLSVRGGGLNRRAAAAAGLLFAVPIAGACIISARAGDASGFEAISKEVTELLGDIESLFTASITDSAGHNRWGLWSLTAGYIADRPILGYGCEGISAMLQAATGRSSAHNELLTYAAFFGIPAAVFYCSGVLASLWCSMRKRISCSGHLPFLMASAGYFISSLVGVSMFYTTPFFFIFLGCALTEE